MRFKEVKGKKVLQKLNIVSLVITKSGSGSATDFF